MKINLKILTLFFIILTLVNFSFMSKADASVRQSTKVMHTFGAFGPLFGFGSIRFGGQNFEFGLLTRSFLGINYMFSAGSMLYFSFGTGLDLYGVSPGVYGASGLEFFSIGIFELRFEMAATSSLGNYTEGQLLLGANLVF